MKTLILCLLIWFLAPIRANAYQIPAEMDSMLNPVIKIGDDLNKLESVSKKGQETSQISLQTVAVPPTTWVVGFGLCLVLLGYVMKNKIH